MSIYALVEAETPGAVRVAGCIVGPGQAAWRVDGSVPPDRLGEALRDAFGTDFDLDDARNRPAPISAPAAS